MGMYLERKILTSLEKSVFSGEMDHGQIVEQCRSALKRFGVRVELSYLGPEDILEGYQFAVSGYYDSSRVRLPILLRLHFSLDHGSMFKWTPARRKDFVFKVSQVLQHELIHKHQAQYRDELLGYKDEDYLANKDEIGAYAHDIMLELKQNNNGWNILRHISQYNIPSYNIYSHSFGQQDWHKVKNRLLKQVFKWMEN